MYENYYHEQLAKISTCVKYSIDAYHRYMLPFCFEKLKSRNYYGDSLNVVSPVFSLFSTASLDVCTCMFSPVVSTVFYGASPISPQCFPCFLFCGLRNLCFEFLDSSN